MPLWAYFVIGFVILALVLLTFRRNQVAYHAAPLDYGDDFRLVLETVDPAMGEIREALRDGEIQPLARAASGARTRIHASISNLDRLGVSTDLPAADQDLLNGLQLRLRQAMENYEWAARIAESTDLLENAGLRRAFDSLAGSGDQLCAEVRYELAALTPPAEPAAAGNPG
jgi:hypothetical protein